MEAKKHFGLLGKKVSDRITGQKGVVDSICFDLYGCVQATINPGLDKDGKLINSHWFDVSRLKVEDETPVMEQLNFEFGEVAQGLRGPASKPERHSC